MSRNYYTDISMCLKKLLSVFIFNYFVHLIFYRRKTINIGGKFPHRWKFKIQPYIRLLIDLHGFVIRMKRTFIFFQIEFFHYNKLSFIINFMESEETKDETLPAKQAPIVLKIELDVKLTWQFDRISKNFLSAMEKYKNASK